MKSLTLIVGSKSASSWSLRPWLFLKHHGIAFEETVIALDRPDTRAQILQHSPSGRVPALKHGAVTVWESLAICEYAAETFGLPLAWPMDPAARALARSAAAEMHAGFADLRREMPFNPTRKPETLQVSDRAAADIGRVRQIWRGCRREYGKGGEWLFGAFGIVDAMYAPVALRLHGYGVALDGPEREYVYAMLMHPAVNEWIEGAAAESPPVGSFSGRMKERAIERTLEKTLEQTLGGGGREVTEPVRRDDEEKVRAVVQPPHRSEQILPSVPIYKLAPAPVRAQPDRPAPAETPDVTTPKSEPSDPSDANAEAEPTRLKSFILPP